MFSSLIEAFEKMIGLDNAVELIIFMGLRGLIMYGSIMLFIKMNKKFLGVRTAANFTLFAMFGSMCAGAVIGDAHFLPVLVTIFVLGLVNKYIAIILFKFPWIEEFFEGQPILLVSGGVINWENIGKHHITKSNLINALQTQLHTNDMSIVEFAYLATDGTINFIAKK